MSRTSPLILLLLLVGLALLSLVPILASDFYLLLFTKVLALAIFAMSLDLLVGYTGLVSFGHAAYFGIAAYAAALLAPQYSAANLLLTLPASIVAAALVALVVGALCVRTSGIYFIMVTLAFAQMAFFAFHDLSFAGGSDGKLIFAKPQIRLGDVASFDLSHPMTYYYFVLGALALSYLALRMLVRSPFGYVIQGIKVNEARMRALGYATYRYKLASFVIAGAFAGLAGYLAAYQAEYVSPALLGWRESGIVLMMVILGGGGTLFGAIVGAVAMVLLQELFADLTEHWMLLMGVFVALAVIYLPDGIAGLAGGLGARQPVAEETADE